ncbi:MAG: hypothetical protein ABW092_19455 [Candidatus Thiodiazotropha sp.]
MYRVLRSGSHRPNGDCTMPGGAIIEEGVGGTNSGLFEQLFVI